MSHNLRVLHITSPQDACRELSTIGADPKGIQRMTSKMQQLNLKLERINAPAANILKQQMLSLGGDAAVARGVINISKTSSDVILMGSRKQLCSLPAKLTSQPFGLKQIGKEIKRVLAEVDHTDLCLELRNRTLALGERTHIMGVVNVTPDSFSDGGRYLDPRKAIKRAGEMVEEGADIIDIGGESSRPGSDPVGLDEELKRVMPVIEEIAPKLGVPVSIDTYKSEVARRALDGGAEIVNDISALNFDPRMAELIAQRDVPVILMHMRGTPKDMQENVHYHSLISEILVYLRESITRAEAAGIDPKKIIIDPGIGFGKSVEDNLRIIRHLAEFKVLGKPILLGTSRKSFIGKILNAEVEERLAGSIASAVVGIINGANIVRVHEVKEAKRAVLLTDAIRFADR